MEKQRPDINPMPHFELLPPRINPLELAGRGLSRALHFIFDQVRGSAPDYMSDHYRTEEMLLGEQDGTRAD